MTPDDRMDYSGEEISLKGGEALIDLPTDLEGGMPSQHLDAVFGTHM